MKLVDMKEVPKKIGEAEIVVKPRARDTYYNRRQASLAYREKKTIFLDSEANGQFYSIFRGQQFLFTADEVDGSRNLFFGGMDESPFLVQLRFQLIENLVNGEQAFFNALKPSVIKRWECRFGKKAKRQGDFFAVATKRKLNWEGFILTHVQDKEIKMSVVKGQSLRRTRHSFSGIFGTIGDLMIGEGRVEAPDHEPLILDYPHLIEQAVGFVQPETAD